MKPTTPPEARLAATMVLVRDDPFEVLMVRRHAKAVFASALVFPGGVVDEDDYSDDWMPLLGSGRDLPNPERAVRIAGIRETFEETALLLATRPDGGPINQPERTEAPFIDVVRASGGLLMLDDVQPFAHWMPLLGSGRDLPNPERAVRIAGIRETYEETALLLATRPDGGPINQPERTEAPFIDVVRASGGLLMLDDVQPFAHWITPEVSPRRFDTYFLLARAPVGQHAIPDGGETVALEWASPGETVKRAESDAQIIFPTLLNLMRLAESTDSESAIDAARRRPLVTVMPTVEVRDGVKIAVIPAEAGYGATEYPAPGR